MDRSNDNSLVVVALPRPDDPVWKLSSEKVPHMTLLYLGEASNANIPEIWGFIEHVFSTSITRFGLDIDHRGELGEDKADVLFFQKNHHTEKLEEIRSYLLGNSEIKKAYDSAFQYPQWTPHLTLGYPENPAKEWKRDWPINWVEFDRISLWTGDSEGPTLLLEQEQFKDISMSDNFEDVLTSLFHYGVKGQKWGRRRTRAQIDADSADVSAVKTAKSKISSNKTTDVLSNKELRDVVNRMQLEKQYRELTSGNQASKTRLAKGKKEVGNILANVARQQAARVVNDVASRQVASMLKK